MSIPKTLTTKQCDAFIEELVVCQGTTKQITKGCRNLSMGILMLETGIRVGELCALRIDDLWYADQPVENLVVRKEIAKNNAERLIPISTVLRGAIIDLDRRLWYPNNFSTSDFAFSSGANGKPLSTRTVERIILAAGRAAIHLDVTPHMLRHTFGSKMMRKTNARIVQALLGHSSLQSTQIYMHPNAEDLKKAINS